MTEKLPPIKSANFPTMNDYKSAAKASQGTKIKSFAGGGQVTDFPIRAPVIATLPSSYPSVLKAGRLADGGTVSRMITVHGKAAEQEMAKMERQTKLSARLSKKD